MVGLQRLGRFEGKEQVMQVQDDEEKCIYNNENYAPADSAVRLQNPQASLLANNAKLVFSVSASLFIFIFKQKSTSKCQNKNISDFTR